MTRKAMIITSIASLMLGASAVASMAQQPHGPHGGPERMFVRMLQQFDTDTNGQISKDEATAGAEKRFTEIDVDNDGVLTPGELRKHREAKMKEWHDARKDMREEASKDKPGPDGGPPGEELAEGGDMMGNGPQGGPPEDMCADGPRDGKGKWRRDDHGGKEGYRMAEGDGPDGWRPHRWNANDRGDHMGRKHHGAGMMLRIADTDESGQISKDEFLAMTDKMFTRMDRNKDGVISADDMPKHPF